MKPNPALASFDRLVGTWDVTGSHPYLPGRTLRGRVTFERVDGGAFVRMHMELVDEEIPEGVAFFGTDDGDRRCTMLYFDERGVSRRYEVAFHERGVTWSREDPQLSQRFQVTIGSGGDTMEGEGSMRKGAAAWQRDLRLSYVRAR
jgi:hypothetical protein